MSEIERTTQDKIAATMTGIMHTQFIILKTLVDKGVVDKNYLQQALKDQALSLSEIELDNAEKYLNMMAEFLEAN